MNHNISDWNMESEPRSFHDLLFLPEQKKATGPNQEIIDLLWRNGHVVTHSQNHRKLPFSSNEYKQTDRLEPASQFGVACGNPGNSFQEEETASWFQYPIDCTIDKELCSEFFYEMPVANSFDADKLIKNAAENVNVSSQHISKHYTMQENSMPPPKAHVSSENGGFVNFSHFSRPVRTVLGISKGSIGEKILETGTEGEVGESSAMRTVSSSVCGSNQVQNYANQSGATGVLARGLKEDVQKRHADTYETTISSSSGWSGSSSGRMGKQRGSNVSNKRKGRDGEESECHSQEGEYQSIEANKPLTSARRSRAAEVHNLSERRRRDRINEKMRALRELIPYCNKTDKASMLDEAIEYLKSLQLQVQLMWMGSGTTPMMFPAFQHYISRMGMGMSHTTMPYIHGPVPLPRVPVVHQSMPSAPTSNQTPMCQSLTLNPFNFPRQTQNVPSLENYMQFFSFHHMQPPSQAMNLYPHGSHMVRQNWIPLTSSNGLPTEGGSSSGNIQNNTSG